MSAMLTADWFLLGRDSYYRKFEIYSMKWHQDINMDNFIVSGSSYGGPIAIIRDYKKFVKVQGAGKPVIVIYSGSGKQLSSLVWKYNQPITFGWSHREHLLCVQDDSSVYIHDMNGGYKHMFCIEKETYNIKVIDAKIFSSLQGTGVAILTSTFKIFLVNNVYVVKKRQLCDSPSSCESPPTAWAIVASEQFTEAIMARGRELFCLKDSQYSVLQPDITHDHSAILEIAVSLNAKHIALFTDAGYLWLGSVDFRNKYCEVYTDCIARPKQLVWCGTEAVMLYYNTSVSIFGKTDGEMVTYAYDGSVHLVPEIDGVRILSGGQHELVQKVPLVVQQIFRINSTDPGSFLLEASKQYQKRSHRADEYISLVRNNLIQAVQQCVEAAGHEFDTDTQKMLIRAAQFGKCFLADTNCVDRYVDMCRLLRVLNAIRDPRIGLPLTCEQLRALTFGELLDRLVTRHHFYLAIQIAKFLRLPECESRTLTHWASYKVAQTHLDEDMIAREIADKIGKTPTVSFSEIAHKAADGGRTRLAIKLLDYEPRARLQVPLLLQLSESRPALLKAIESGDTDLMYKVILHMRENMPLADFRMTVRNYPTAQSLYKKYCQEHNPQGLQEIHVQEDDFSAQADQHVKECLDMSDSLTWEASLQAAYEAYRKGRNELHASICDETHKLLKFQKLLEQQHGERSFVGKSVHDTCSTLLSLGEHGYKAAEKLRSDFKIPERRYWWLRIRSLADRSNWIELEKLSKSKKSPIGYGPFVDVCLENDNVAEAVKYLPRVADDLKMKYYMKAGFFEEAAKIAFEQKNQEGLLYLQRRCANQVQVVEKINTYIMQLNSRK